MTLVRGLHGATIALTNRPMTIHARYGRLVATPMAFPAARLAAPFYNAFLEDTTVLVDEGTATSTSFWTIFRAFLSSTPPHNTLWAVFYLVLRLTSCRLVLAIRCYAQFGASASLSFVRIAKTGRLSAQAVLAQPFTAGFSFQCSDYDAEHRWLFALAVRSHPACSTILVAIDDDREASIFAEIALQPGASGNMVAVIKVRQLRHHFCPFLAHFSAPHHPTHTVCYTLLRAYPDRVLIGVWNPML